MSEDDFSFPTLGDNDEEDDNKFWNVSTSTIFLVDATEEMHENDYLQTCLESFKNIVWQKCRDNKKDKMGLILFGTKKSNCEIDNVTVLQEYDTVTINTLQKIKDILKNGVSEYEPVALDSKYPLYNALSHVFQILQSSKASQKVHKTILLCTCNSKPNFKDPSEKRSIEHLVATFKYTQTKLLVAGLSDSWSDAYYKDLQIISGTYTDNNYKQFHLKELEETILRPAKTVIKTQWKIHNNISVPVSVLSIIASSPKYPTKKKMNKKDNELLETRQALQEQTIDEFFETADEPQSDKGKYLHPEQVRYYQSHGGQNIVFDKSEIKQIKLLNTETGIEILAFKPVSCDPSYHIKSPYFVTCAENSNSETKLFFMAFVSKCAKKKVMVVCKIITTLMVFIGTMIPSEDDGGFYLYKMPYLGSIRDLEQRLSDYIFNSEKKCPVHEQALFIFKKLIKLSEVEFDPKMFKNPKLDKITAHLEALAFDEELKSLPPDRTLPPPINGDAETLTTALKRLLDLQEKRTNKRSQQTQNWGEKKQKLDVKAAIESKKLHTLTVAELKEYLKENNQPTQGTKTVLIERIYNYRQK